MRDRSSYRLEVLPRWLDQPHWREGWCGDLPAQVRNGCRSEIYEGHLEKSQDRLITAEFELY